MSDTPSTRMQEFMSCLEGLLDKPILYDENNKSSTIQRSVEKHRDAIRDPRTALLLSDQHEKYLNFLSQIRIHASMTPFERDRRKREQNGLISVVLCMLAFDPEAVSRLNFEGTQFDTWWPRMRRTKVN